MHDVQGIQDGKRAGEHRGNNGKVFGDIVRNGKCGQRTARHQQLLANFHDFNELGRIRVEIHHITRFFGSLGSGIHGNANIGLGQRGRVVGAVPRHGDQFSLPLLTTDQVHFLFGRSFGQKIIHTGFARDSCSGERIVAGDHHGLDPHGA